MKKTILFLFLPFCLLISGCVSSQQTAPAVATVSKNVPLSKIKGTLIETYIADGWQFERESAHLVTFIRENTNMLMSALYHTKYEARVFNRESVVITETENGYMLRASQAIISNYGSAFEKAQPTGTKGAVRLASVATKLNQ